jgi:hypothetical protein
MSEYDAEVVKYKPKMELLPAPGSPNWETASLVIHGETVIMAKADGEFNVLHYCRGASAFTKNKYGRKETASGLQAIADAQTMLTKNRSVKSATMLVEMYVNYQVNGKSVLMRVSDFIHYLKCKSHTERSCRGKNCYGKTVQEIRGRIALGIFDLVELNGKKVNASQLNKLKLLENMLNAKKGAKPVPHCPTPSKPGRFHVLPWIYVGEVSPGTMRKEITAAWATYKEKLGYEGLVVYADSTFKVKPEVEIDAVIVGLNKNDGYSKHLGTSVKLAVMKDKNTFVEIGDVASGISIKMRAFLWNFRRQYPLDETTESAYMKPLFVVKILMTDFFNKDMPMWKLVNGRRVQLGLYPSITMRHPKLVDIRQDKSCALPDVGIDQLAIIKG